MTQYKKRPYLCFLRFKNIVSPDIGVIPRKTIRNTAFDPRKTNNSWLNNLLFVLVDTVPELVRPNHNYRSFTTTKELSTKQISYYFAKQQP